MNPGLPYSQQELGHLAELAQLVFEVRPLYAVGYIITLQREFGLPATYPVPSFSTLGLRDSYQAQRDEMARGIKDARERVKPRIFATAGRTRFKSQSPNHDSHRSH